MGQSELIIGRFQSMNHTTKNGICQYNFWDGFDSDDKLKLNNNHYLAKLVDGCLIVYYGIPYQTQSILSISSNFTINVVDTECYNASSAFICD